MDQEKKGGAVKRILKGVLVGIVACIVLVIVVATLSAVSQPPTTSDTTIASQATVKEAPLVATKTIVAPKEWTKVFSLSASANKQSNTFHLNGGQQKVSYDLSGGNFAVCSVYIVPEGHDINSEGGFPIVMISDPSSDETMMRKTSGDYYLDLRVANGTCDIRVDELR